MNCKLNLVDFGWLGTQTSVVDEKLSCMLQEFPPVSKRGKKSAIKACDIEHNLDGLTLDVVCLLFYLINALIGKIKCKLVELQCEATHFGAHLSSPTHMVDNQMRSISEDCV